MHLLTHHFPTAAVAGLFLLVHVFAGRVRAAEDVVVTVHGEPRQTFRGFGGAHFEDGNWSSVPEAKRKEMVKLVWGDLDFRYFRAWCHLDADAAEMARRYKTYLEDVAEVQDSLTVLFAPTARNWDKNVSTYVAHYTDVMKAMKEEQGMPVHVTGIMNEPNAGSRLTPAQVPQFVKLFRQEMDARGLNDVQIIAPEVSNVDDLGESMIEALANDKEAVDLITGFSTHCYNMCMKKWVSDLVFERKKEHWQTESSHVGFDAAAHVISDINLGISHWIHFFALYYSDADAERFAVIGYQGGTGNYVIYPQYYFYKEIGKTLPVGTVIRQCSTDMEAWDSRYEWMENTYGDKPPMCATAGQTPAGHLNIAIVNKSGSCPGGCGVGAQMYPSTEFNVTFVVEELVEKGGKHDMEMHRVTNNTTGDAEELAGAVLDNGYVGVSIKPGEMITLRSADPILSTDAIAARPAVPHGVSSDNVAAAILAGRRIEVTLGSGGNPQHRSPGGYVSLYAVDGKLIGTRPAPKAGGAVTFDGRGLARGLYFVKADQGAESRTSPVLVR